MFRGLASISGCILLLLVLFLFREAWPAISQIGLIAFFVDPSWHPQKQLYNLTPMLLGSLLTMCGAVSLATPLGIGSAIFSHYYAPPSVNGLYRRFIELLAGIPSVVYGLWGIVVLIPIIGTFQLPGSSLLAGILILSLMILPTIAVMAEASFQQVPPHLIQGSSALGLHRWSIIWQVILPSVRPALGTAVILAAGRAIGETMAVLMVCGNVVQVPTSLFAPIRTLTANIALEMAFALGEHRAALYVCGLLVLGIILCLVGLAQRLKRDVVHG
jgi:phosphate transport system permease protein